MPELRGEEQLLTLLFGLTLRNPALDGNFSALRRFEKALSVLLFMDEKGSTRPRAIAHEKSVIWHDSPSDEEILPRDEDHAFADHDA